MLLLRMSELSYLLRFSRKKNKISTDKNSLNAPTHAHNSLAEELSKIGIRVVEISAAQTEI